LPEFFSRDYLIGPLQQRFKHQKRVVFDVQWDATLIEAPGYAIDFERSETESDWLVSRVLVQAIPPRGRKGAQHTTCHANAHDFTHLIAVRFSS
jgi:hypothetical protein